MLHSNSYLLLAQLKLGVNFIKYLFPQCLELLSKSYKNENVCILGNLIGYQGIAYGTIIEIVLV